MWDHLNLNYTPDLLSFAENCLHVSSSCMPPCVALFLLCVFMHPTDTQMTVYVCVCEGLSL